MDLIREDELIYPVLIGKVCTSLRLFELEQEIFIITVNSISIFSWTNFTIGRVFVFFKMQCYVSITEAKSISSGLPKQSLIKYPAVY